VLVSSSFFGRNTRSATADIPTVPSFIAPALVACRKGKQLIDVLFNIFRASYLNFTAFPSSLPLPDPPIAFYGEIPTRIPIEPHQIAALKIKEVSLAIFRAAYLNFTAFPSSLPLPDPPIAFYGKIPIRIPIEPCPIAALKIKEVSLAELMTKKYYSFVLVPSYQKFHCLPLIPAPPRPSHPVLRKNSNTTIPNCCSKSKGGEFGRICVKKILLFCFGAAVLSKFLCLPHRSLPLCI
jgi:hypothetical protein